MRYSPTLITTCTFMKYLVFSLVVAALSITGCAQPGDQPDAAQTAPGAGTDYHVLMAEIALQRQQFATAAREYHSALAGNEDAELAARAGRVIYEHGTYEHALDAAHHWAELDPEAVEPRRYLALLYLQSGAVRKALPLWDGSG